MSDDLKIDRRTLLKTAVSAGAAAAAPAVLATDANAVRWSEVHDVVIAGAGGAGLAAAVMAGGISKDVVVLEKTQDVGGNVTGGVHGANYMGGNALSEVFTFGRIAGENAVQEPFA